LNANRAKRSLPCEMAWIKTVAYMKKFRLQFNDWRQPGLRPETTRHGDRLDDPRT
jgi:hypothetical protein